MTPWKISSRLCLLVFLCRVEPSEEGCNDYEENNWHSRLSPHKLYVLLEMEPKGKETRDMFTHTLNKWCCQDLHICNMLEDCFHTSPPTKCSSEKEIPSQLANEPQQGIKLMSLKDFNCMMNSHGCSETIYECVPLKPVTAPPPSIENEIPGRTTALPTADSEPTKPSDSKQDLPTFTDFVYQPHNSSKYADSQQGGNNTCVPHANPEFWSAATMTKLVFLLAVFNIVLVLCCIYLCYLRRRDRKLWQASAERSPSSEGDAVIQLCLSPETVTRASTYLCSAMASSVRDTEQDRWIEQRAG